MTVRSPASRFVLGSLTAILLAASLAVSCSKSESPTSPPMASASGRATIAGTVTTTAPAGQTGDPLAGVTVAVTSTRQSAQTDQAGRFTLTDVPAGTVTLQIRGAGIDSQVTVNAAAGMITRISVAVSRGRNTVTLLPRMEGNGAAGIVSGVNASGFTLKTAQGTVNVQVTSSTIIRLEDKIATLADVKVGMRAEAEGDRQPDGSILAKKVELEAAEQEEPTKTPTPTGTITPSTPTPTRTPKPQEVELEGTVGTVGASSFILITKNGNVTIQVNGSTQFKKDDGTASFADIKTGLRVEVEGTLQADGSVLAREVDIEDENENEPTKTPTVTGTVVAGSPTATRTPEREPTEPEEATKTPNPNQTPTPTRTQKPEGGDD